MTAAASLAPRSRAEPALALAIYGVMAAITVALIPLAIAGGTRSPSGRERRDVT